MPYKYSTVASAARKLDELKPGWAELIDTKKLDMTSYTNCIVGQLYGDYGQGPNLLHREARTSSGDSLLCSNEFKSEWLHEIEKRLRGDNMQAKHNGDGAVTLSGVGDLTPEQARLLAAELGAAAAEAEKEVMIKLDHFYVATNKSGERDVFLAAPCGRATVLWRLRAYEVDSTQSTQTRKSYWQDVEGYGAFAEIARPGGKPLLNRGGAAEV